jgi:hypothetical protein
MRVVQLAGGRTKKRESAPGLKCTPATECCSAVSITKNSECAPTITGPRSVRQQALFRVRLLVAFVQPQQFHVSGNTNWRHASFRAG